MISTTADTLITASTVCVRPLALTPMLFMMATAPITTRATSWRAPIAQWIACPVTCRSTASQSPPRFTNDPKNVANDVATAAIVLPPTITRIQPYWNATARAVGGAKKHVLAARLGQHGSELRVRQRARKREESRCDPRPQRERRRPNELRDDRALEEHAGANDNAHNQPRRVDGAETADELGRTGGGQGARLDVRRSTFGAGRSTFRRKR